MTAHDDCRWVFTDCCGALIDADCDSDTTVNGPINGHVCEREEVPSGR